MNTNEPWADRIWHMGQSTRIGFHGRMLANELLERVIDDPDQAAFLIAVLVELANIGDDPQ